MDTGPTLFTFVQLLASLILVLGLMGALALAMKKLGLGGHITTTNTKKRLKVIESIPLDGRRRLLLIQRDDIQHLVILGINSETVVETAIQPLDDIPHA